MSVERRNNDLQLSEQLYIGQGDLEKYLLRVGTKGGIIDTDSLVRYSDLPGNLTSLANEKFLATLSSQTKKDSDPFNRIEYGGYAHMQVNPRRLLYPVEPTKGFQGTEYIPGGEVKVVGTLVEFVQDENTYPVLNAHSHPKNTPFSDPDLYFMVRSDIEFPHVAMSLTTPSQYNLLMLRTAETPFLSPDQFKDAYSDAVKKDWKAAIEYSERLVEEGAGSDDLTFLDVYGENYDSDSRTYYSLMLTACTLSERLKFGLYFSQKDGIYRKLGREQALEYLENLLQKAARELVELREE